MKPTKFLLITAALASAATPPTIKPTDPIEISQLDDCIQQRFLDRSSFGMSRVARPRPHGFRIFEPENPQEQTIVGQLRQKGFDVAVFLVGRLALMDAVTPSPRSGLQGPALVTSLPGTQLPDATQLFSDGRHALATIGDRPGYDVRNGEWTIAMRPLRASNQGCVTCHSFGGTAPKLGEAIGIAMYVYRQH